MKTKVAGSPPAPPDPPAREDVLFDRLHAVLRKIPAASVAFRSMILSGSEVRDPAP